MRTARSRSPSEIVYDALAIVGERAGEDPVETLEAAIKQLTPVLEVRSRRVGGATYQVPVEVPARRARTLAVRWLVTSHASDASTRCPSGSRTRSSTHQAAGQRLEAQGRHLPDGPGQQGVRALPLVAALAASRDLLASRALTESVRTGAFLFAPLSRGALPGSLGRSCRFGPSTLPAAAEPGRSDAQLSRRQGRQGAAVQRSAQRPDQLHPEAALGHRLRGRRMTAPAS